MGFKYMIFEGLEGFPWISNIVPMIYEGSEGFQGFKYCSHDL